jgi:hypothetical protein
MKDFCLEIGIKFILDLHYATNLSTKFMRINNKEQSINKDN